MDIATTHNTRCHKCKSNIYFLLNRIHGAIEHKYQATGVSVRLASYRGSDLYPELEAIHEALIAFRGYESFVNAKTLQRCDLFVPAVGSVVELDERQHFSAPRAVSLEHYPATLAVGFDRKSYITRCNQLQQKDNDPKYPYRDEQRA